MKKSDNEFDKFNKFIEDKLNKGGRRRLWLTLILVIIGLSFVTIADIAVYQYYIPDTVNVEEFFESLKAGDIDTIYYDSSKEMMRYTLLNDDTRNMTQENRAKYTYDKTAWRQTLYPGGQDFRREMLTNYHVNLKIQTFQPMLSGFWSLIFSMIITISIILIILNFMRKGMSGSKKYISIQGTVNTKFKDVIGQDEVLKDLDFIVQMMRGKKIDNLGAKVPKGILLSGPPGTGKTLIARAVAGEADVPFFSANASEFIDMYVGVGPKAVRSLFKQARKHKPCVIFIDEIDAVAATRGTQGNTSEDNKTVNALLQEMDGFDKERGIFVIAATNNPDSLDPAIVRAGRFDRQVIVNPPKDWKTRKELFDFYIKDTACNANIENLAKQTVGFTGADIASVVNEAKLVAAMQDKTSLDDDCFETAIDKKVFKSNRSDKNRYKKDIEIAAYHEAGHAVMHYLCNSPIARASIIGSTSGVGGVVFGADKDTSQFSTKTEYENQIKICYAGRAAELETFKDISDGAGSDITQATKYLYIYACKVGMHADFGALDIDVLKQSTPFAVPVDLLSQLSVKFMDETDDIIRQNYHLVKAVALELLDKETLSGDAVNNIIEMAKKLKK